MDAQRLLAHKFRNRLQTAGLILLLALLLVCLAWILGGPDLATASLAAVAALALFGPRASPRLVMALYRGRYLAPFEAPQLYAIVAALAQRAELPQVPRLYLIPSRVMNAFATGRRDDAVVAVSDGLLRQLSRRERIGVLAHEISHIASDDIQVMSFADLVSRITSLFSLTGQMLLLVSLPLGVLAGIPVPWAAILVLLVAPSLSALVQLALSRSREYEADRRAAELSGDPTGLALALGKLERLQCPLWERILMPDRRTPEPSLLRTHPPTEERVKRLLQLVPRRTWAEPLPHAVPLTEEQLGFLANRRPLPPRVRIGGLWY